jgi:hypothetical protein
MAQKVGYFEDNVVFTEGPFVMVNANGWRIEVSSGATQGCNCVMPHTSVYKLAGTLGYKGKSSDADHVAGIVDRLNSLSRTDHIVQTGNCWVAVDA